MSRASGPRSAIAKAGLAVLPGSVLGAPAAACTLCDSVPAVSVRARLLGPDLWWNASAVLLPLALLVSIIVCVAREPSRERRA